MISLTLASSFYNYITTTVLLDIRSLLQLSKHDLVAAAEYKSRLWT